METQKTNKNIKAQKTIKQIKQSKSITTLKNLLHRKSQTKTVNKTHKGTKKRMSKTITTI